MKGFQREWVDAPPPGMLQWDRSLSTSDVGKTGAADRCTGGRTRFARTGGWPILGRLQSSAVGRDPMRRSRFSFLLLALSISLLLWVGVSLAGGTAGHVWQIETLAAGRMAVAGEVSPRRVGRSHRLREE